MSDVIADTLTTLIEDILARAQRIGATRPLPDDPAVIAWVRDQIARGYLALLVPLAGSTEQAQNSEIGLTLRDLAAVTDGDVRGGPEADELAVRDMTQSVAEALFARPGTAEYTVPPEWWAAGVGRLCRLALAVSCGDDDLMTISEAAEQLGVTPNAVSNAISAGRIAAVANPEAANPRHGGRLVFRAEVERWQRERAGR